MRKILLVLWASLLGVFSAPVLAVCLGSYDSYTSAYNAVVSEASSLGLSCSGAIHSVSADTATSNGYSACINEGYSYNSYTIFLCAGQQIGAHHSSTPPSPGMLIDSVGEWTEPCPTDPTKAITDPACAPAPPNPCEPRSGESVTGRLFVCNSPLGQLCPSGNAPQSMNFEGCFANVSGVSDCWQMSNGDVFCDYIGTLNGVSSVEGADPVAGAGGGSAGSPSGGTVTAAPPASVTCPTGLTYEADYNGLGPACIDYGDPGSPSTTDAPGTTPTPDTTACPVGYAIDTQGRCVGAAPTDGYSCPVGFTLEGTNCVSAASGAIGTTAANYSGEASAIGAAWAGVTGLFDQAKNANPIHGWNLSLPSIFPSAPQCATWTILTHVIDPCPTANKIRNIAEFCLYVLTVFGLFRILFGPRVISQ